ncbi:MAG: glycosyltransferase family 4 protein, partial [Planctomycetota bacterium]|nr:glycosyltransferase family 4 protein [Planctomycetota bacterium]
VQYQAGFLKCSLCVRARHNPFRNRAIRRAIKGEVDLLIAVSAQMAAALQANDLGEPQVVFNGIALGDETVPAKRVADLRKKLGLEGRKVIFHGGRLDRLKGSLELVEALEQVRRSVPEAVLLTVGNALPGFAEEIDALAQRLGMTNAVIHAGWLTGEELDAAYALADVVASPSLCFESFGLMNLEAMRASKPVVASFWGGPSDVVRDGVTGYLVNPLQIGVIADRLTRLLQDHEFALQMGREGRKRAEENFSVGDQIARVEELFADCLAARASTRHTNLT